MEAEKLFSFGKRMQESDDCDFSEIGDDLVNFSEKWIAQRDSLLEALKVMTSLVRIKYGNLDADVYKEIEKADAAIAAARG